MRDLRQGVSCANLQFYIHSTGCCRAKMFELYLLHKRRLVQLGPSVLYYIVDCLYSMTSYMQSWSQYNRVGLIVKHCCE